MTDLKNKIALVYDIKGNPFINSSLGRHKLYSDATLPSEIDRVIKGIKANGYEVDVIDGARGLLDKIKILKSNNYIIFNKARGFSGIERKSPVPIICDMHELPMVGSTAYPMSLCRHKFHTNRILNGFGFNAPSSFLASSPDEIKEQRFIYPVIVKPNSEGGAIGIDDGSICYNLYEVKEKAEYIFKELNQDVIIEEYIDAEEYKISVLGSRGRGLLTGGVEVLKNGLPMSESIQTRNDVLNESISYASIPDRSLEKELHTLAITVHKFLGLKDYSRIDFRRSSKGKLYCMEVSTHPDLGNHSSFVSAIELVGVSYNNMLKHIIESCLDRYHTSHSKIEDQ